MLLRKSAKVDQRVISEAFQKSGHFQLIFQVEKQSRRLGSALDSQHFSLRF